MTAPAKHPAKLSVVSRRTTLEWMTKLSVMSALPAGSWAAAASAIERNPLPTVTALGYGIDPNLIEPIVTWPRIMTSHQVLTIAALADLILPADADAAAPSAVGVPDFINEWFSAPYPDQMTDRAVILEGLDWIDAESVRRAQHPYIECDRQTQRAIIDVIAARSPDASHAAQDNFFRRLQALVAVAYYTTTEGFRALGYTGNVALLAYPPVTDLERSMLDGALQKLGL